MATMPPIAKESQEEWVQRRQTEHEVEMAALKAARQETELCCPASVTADCLEAGTGSRTSTSEPPAATSVSSSKAMAEPLASRMGPRNRMWSAVGFPALDLLVELGQQSGHSARVGSRRAA